MKNQGFIIVRNNYFHVYSLNSSLKSLVCTCKGANTSYVKTLKYFDLISNALLVSMERIKPG